ncbi:hypothetical protein QVD17_07499 [Tagetes erecta]|uniref:AIPP2-like SPOC-like domain-containing protein n=1 Tax=Tagetes erecta TaxID=13708 RepID=A0AAD8PC24_TARER|nr:hypothetical protein QVD17_07499 [Tagetes erecta]
MGKADEISDKLNDVRTVKNKTYERKQQTTSETSNLESSSSSYNTFFENSGSKVNKKASHINKNNDGPNISADADNDYRLRNIEDKSSLSSDEYENNKVSVGNHKELATRYKKKEAGPNSDGGNLHEENSKLLEVETSLQSHHTDDSDESDVVEHDVKVCDICGDTGREDLLAICCRCIDGAEHTYCMKLMVDQVPQGDWLCEECKVEEVKSSNRQTLSPESLSGKDQASDVVVRKVSGKRHAEELASSLSFKKQALETTTGSTKDVDHGKVKSFHQFSSDSHYGSESKEESRSPATRPRLQSLRGALSKSSSFNFPSARSKTKLVDDIILQRQKSAKERSSHDTIAAKEMSKSMSFRSTNYGSFGPSGSKVKMLSPKLSHVQDLKSLNSKKERSFEKIKSSSSSSAASTPKADRLFSSRGETNSVSPGSNSEVKPLKGDSKIMSGLKSTNRSANTSAEAPVSLGQINEQLPSSPTKVAATSSGIINAVEQKSIDNSSNVAICKESMSHADGTNENTTCLNAGSSGVSCQNDKQTGHSAQGSVGNNVAAMKNSKDVKKGGNKLKDAIEAALLKKPGIYRKNKVSDQPDESSVATMNPETAVVDRAHSRNAGSLTSSDASLTDWHGKISRSSNFNHSKQSNGNSYKQSLILPVEGNHLTAGQSSHDDVALPSVSRNTPIPDNEFIWQGSFEINRRGKTAEFWDGLQAHLSTCASSRVFEVANKFPHKILLNGVSRASAWPTQFENNGVKEDNIAIYFFAKDIESYEKSYQFLLDDMIRGDLALIGSVNGTELLIFPSNQLPEKSNRWNMLFFLWGVFRGKKKEPLHHIPNNPETSCVPQSVSSISTDKTTLAENVSLVESVEKDKHVDSESKVNSSLQDSSCEKAIDSISGPVESVNVVPISSKETISESRMKNEPIIIDLSEDDDVNGTNETNSKRNASSQIGEQEGNLSKKQKYDLYGAGNSNGEMHFFPVGKEKTQQKPVFALDLNEDISCLAGETDNIIMTKKDVDGDVASSLSLSLAFSPLDKDDEDNRGTGKWQSGPSMLLFRDKVDKQ